MNTYLIQDTTLSSIADAIRLKAGTSSAFSPAQMVSEIENLPTGGGDIDAFIERTISGSYENSTVSIVGGYVFYNCSALTSISLPLATSIGSSAFGRCTALTSVSLPSATSIGSFAFYYCSALTSINLPSATLIGSYVFASCTALTSVSLPSATSIGSYAFTSCTALTSINLPSATTIGSNAFVSCTALTSINLPSATTIGSYAFTKCYNLLSLYLTNSVICTLSGTNAFSSTPISNYTASTGGVYGSIYVPASLLTSYKTATNWTTFSSRFVGI